MEKRIVNIFEKLIISDDYVEVINEFINTKAIDVDYLIHFIVEHIEHIENESKWEHLADFIADEYFQKKSLSKLKDQIDSIDIIHPSYSQIMKFIVKVLNKISKCDHLLTLARIKIDINR